MMNDTPAFKDNSLDMIRLIAAMQVAAFHSFHYLPSAVADSLLFEIIKIIPGVPIFFFISGYLISKSYERSPNLFHYSKNRILRIYPALIVCVLVNLILIAYTGYFSNKGVEFSSVLALFTAKSSFLQFYNPDFMRDFGDGVLNGSLWTICVELQFYIILPIIYFIFGKNKQLSNIVLFTLIIVFLIFNRALVYSSEDYGQETLWKIFRVSFAPWFYMFLVGALFQRNFEVLKGLLTKIPILALLIPYLAFILFLKQLDFSVGGNYISPLSFGMLAIFIFRASYWAQKFSRVVLKGNDISYGLYIWHMVVINQILYTQSDLSAWWSVAALALSIFIAFLSWKIIEKPSLALKSFRLYDH